MSDLPVPLRRYLDLSGQPAESAFHTSQVSISFGEAIDPAALRAAWDLVARAHPALRRTFAENGGIVESEGAAFAWNDLDWQSAPPDDLGAAWQTLVEADAARPIASQAEPPGRFAVIRLPNGHGHALWSFHGALLDEMSISTALHRWLQAYDCLRTGEEAPVFDESTESSAPEENADASAESPNLRPLIVLPLPDADTPAGTRRSISHTLERAERAELADAARKLGGDLPSLFGAAWAFVIARATSAGEALVAEPTRPLPGVGRLESFLPQRRSIDLHVTVGDLVRGFADVAPFQPSAKAPATFIFREHTLNDRLVLAMPRWMAADTQLFQKTAAPLALRIVATDRPVISLDYDPAVLSDDAARTMFAAFRGTVEAFATNPAMPLATFPLPGPPAQIESPEAPTSFRTLVPQGVHEMFADAASEMPDAVAVEAGEESLTFAQLNATANQLARLLRKRDVPTGARVGVALARSPRWIIALLGVLKAGATIVPLRPETKEADVAGWIVDSLSEGESRTQPLISFDADAGAIAAEKSRGVQTEATPTALAVAGESGEVAFTHEILAAALASLAGLLELSPTDRVLQFAPTDTFAAIEEALVTLLSGATLVLRPADRWATRTAFQEFVQKKGVTALSVPAPFWSQWIHYLSELSLRVPATLRLAVSTGDLPAPNATAAWAAVAGETRRLHRTSLLAAGGLGLSAIDGGDDPLSAALLGRPSPATIARVVDDRGLPVPPGLAGTVEIASAATPETFTPLGIEAFARPAAGFYSRTAVLLQVAGPESAPPAEAIRHVARAHPQVIDAHAEPRLIDSREEWCLWIVPGDSERGEPHDFREWLSARLPNAPRRVRALPRFPLTDAGEIDLAALSEHLPEDAAAPVARPGSAIEERVRQAISRALGGRRIELDEILIDGHTKPLAAKLLLEAVCREEPRVALADFTTGFSVRSLLRNVRSRGAGASPAWTPLQPLRASGKLPPLIFIHDLDGGAKLYAPLVAHLGDDQPCYAITARGAADPAACHTSIEDMARVYVEAVRAFDANGPYRLLGYGFGGLVAFEMARQLSGAQAQVPLLVALATELPTGNSASAFLAGGWKRALPALFGGKPADESTARRRRTQDSAVYRANQDATRKYSATATSLAAHVFVPDRDFPPHRAVQSGWLAGCRDARTYEVPCSGPEMMDEPAVEAVAAAIGKLARFEELTNEVEE